MPTASPNALAAALEYLDRGWSVMSLCPHDHVGVGKIHRGCRSPGKSPFFPNLPPDRQNIWRHCQSALPTPDDVRGWWSLGHELNVGVALGPISGIVGIDIDDEDGETLLQELSGGELVQTWEYTTGKGRRLVYRLPEHATVKSVSFTRPGTKIEILRFMGGGSQIVLPPSIHASGAVYRWAVGKSPADIPGAEVPAWMIASRAGVSSHVVADGEQIDQGGRHNFLVSLAGSIRKHGANEGVIYAALAEMNAERCNPPLSDEDVRKIARSMLRYTPDEYSGVTIKQAKPKDMPAVADDGRRFKWASELSVKNQADEWLWHGYLPRAGIVLVSALWKAGKTTLLSHLLKALAGNGTFLGHEVKASRVLYVSEEGEQHWVRRRDGLGLRDNTGFYLQPFPVKPTGSDWVQFIRQLRDDAEHYRFDLVVFDTLAKLWPVREENDAGAVDDALMPLTELTKAGVGVLLIHHLRKSGGAEYTGSRGSGALSAFPDIVVELTRFDALNGKDRKRVLKAKGRYDETPDELIIELVGDEYRTLETNGSSGNVLTVVGDSEEARVLAILSVSEEPWVQIEWLRQELRNRGWGMKNKDLNTHLFSLWGRKEVLVRGVVRSKSDPRTYSLASRSTPESQVGTRELEPDDFESD